MPAEHINKLIKSMTDNQFIGGDPKKPVGIVAPGDGSALVVAKRIKAPNNRGKVVNKRLGDRVRKARKAIRLSQAELAKRIGVEQSTITETESGHIRRPKKLRELARELLVSEAWLLGEVEDPLAPASQLYRQVGTVEVPMVGRVEAGAYRVQEPFDDLEAPKVVTAADKRFPNAKMMAFEVSGDSANERGILDKDIVIGIDFVDSGLPVRDGMMVVVQQTRDAGHTLEWTIKEVCTFRDRIELLPRSTNKKHKKIVVKPNFDQETGCRTEEGSEIKILAVVIRVIKEVAI
jgi:transcriptional regulator with XRE-family HTH domain